MAESKRDLSPQRTLWQGGHYDKRGKRTLKNQYRLLEGGAIAEVLCSGPAGSFFIDATDIERVQEFTWCSSLSADKRYLNITTISSGKKLILSRFIMNCYDRSIDVDHISGNRRKNQQANLRCVSRQKNLRNRKLNQNNKTSYNGIRKCVKPAEQVWRLRWETGKPGQYKYRTWSRTDDVIPEAVLCMQKECESAGRSTMLYQTETKECVRWIFSAVWENGKVMKRNFPYTESGLEKALALRDVVYERTGNKNGLRKEYGDGIIPD